VADGGPTTRLYTRTGDRGETGLAGGTRVAKDSPRVRAYGTLDELGAHLGLALAEAPLSARGVRELLLRLQHEVFLAQTEVAAGPSAPPIPHPIDERHVGRLESDIDRFTDRSEPMRSFVLPGGSRLAAQLHVARTVARRAERELWSVHRTEPLRAVLLQWSNRLSDLLFALALASNQTEGVHEIPPDYSV
jgi:cob(I)alamin adenosyltransferase